MLKVLRFFSASIILFTGSLILIFAAILRPFDPKVALMFSKYIAPSLVKIFGVQLEIRNQGLMSKHYPCVYIANHQDSLDLGTFGSSLVLPTVSIGKKEILYIPFFGILYWLTGQILINRYNHGSAMESMNAVAKILNKRKIAVWIAPEGTRSGPRPMQKFKKGAFYLAIQAQLPLVPIVASSYYKNIYLNKLRAGKVILEVLEPISTAGKTVDDVDELMQVSRNKMVEAIARLDKELNS